MLVRYDVDYTASPAGRPSTINQSLVKCGKKELEIGN
jgi:hypothetical protein